MIREQRHDFDEFERLEHSPLCGHDSFESIWQQDMRGVPLTFVQCSGCDLVLQNPRMTEQALGRYFSSDHFINDSKTGDSNFDEFLGYYDYSTWENSYRRSGTYRLGHITDFVKPPAKLLDEADYDRNRRVQPMLHLQELDDVSSGDIEVSIDSD